MMYFMFEKVRMIKLYKYVGYKVTLRASNKHIMCSKGHTRCPAGRVGLVSLLVHSLIRGLWCVAVNL